MQKKTSVTERESLSDGIAYLLLVGGSLISCCGGLQSPPPNFATTQGSSVVSLGGSFPGTVWGNHWLSISPTSLILSPLKVTSEGEDHELGVTVTQGGNKRAKE